MKKLLAVLIAMVLLMPICVFAQEEAKALKLSRDYL